MNQNRGVLYVVWGDEIEPLLQRSIASVKAVHPELPISVVRASDSRRYYALAQKSAMFTLSPYEETLFLDADTVVLDRLDFGFEKASRFGLACCICESPWACRCDALASSRDMIEYNTGVLFFTRKAAPVFESWARLSDMNSAMRFVRAGKPAQMPYNDQCSFAAAVEETGFSPFVLPLNWNFRPEFMDSFFGPLKIFHGPMDPPPAIADVNARYLRGEIAIQQHKITLTL